MATQKAEALWRVRSLENPGYEWTGALAAYWEADGDPISDPFTSEEVSARELLRRWAESVLPDYLNGLIPISWYVRTPDQGVLALMPFQFRHLEDENFLDQFSWPVNVLTGERLNWFQLPVVDKLWRPGREEKGGFIQEATGWKPGILQPHLFLPGLLELVQKMPGGGSRSAWDAG